MAISSLNPSSLSLSLFMLFCLTMARAANVNLRAEKYAHLHFYFQDKISKPNPTNIMVVRGPSKTAFGDIAVLDDALTDGPSPRSKLIGRAQGLITVPMERALDIMMSLVFMEGRYNGSALVVMGRNPIFEPKREMAVVGGSGQFKLARGCAILKTYYFNLTSGDATVEYNVHVWHY